MELGQKKEPEMISNRFKMSHLISLSCPDIFTVNMHPRLGFQMWICLQSKFKL